jgi:hypothetical protein
MRIILLIIIFTCGCASNHDVTHSESYKKFKKTQQNTLQYY